MFDVVEIVGVLYIIMKIIEIKIVVGGKFMNIDVVKMGIVVGVDFWYFS